MFEKVKNIIDGCPGLVGVYYKNLITGDSFGINADQSFVAASVIKVPIMVEVYHQVKQGKISLEQTLQVRAEDKVPSCGALRMMHTGVEVMVRDLCNLMIVISDNTATNMLINLLGMENINSYLAELGLEKTRVNRLLFDKAASARGIQNYFTPAEIGTLLEQMYTCNLVSHAASEDMVDILLNQQLNHKIPYFLPDEVAVAHKTGEDDGTTHDVGIIYAKEPFILCTASNKTDVPHTEMQIREIARLCCAERYTRSRARAHY